MIDYQPIKINIRIFGDYNHYIYIVFVDLVYLL